MFCPPMSAVGRASVSSNETTFGSEVNITCDKGFTFPTGRTVSVVCNSTGGWTNMPDACQGECTDNRTRTLLYVRLYPYKKSLNGIRGYYGPGY